MITKMHKFRAALIITLTNLLICSSVFAQAPEKMSYQAVIRDASNNLVTSQSIGMQISILQGSTSGTEVYVETQTPTTNANGLVSIEIGTGSIVSGDFTTIDWANGLYFIKTETAVEAPLTTYTITGTSQLMSVPYALHANTAETFTGTLNETDPVFTALENKVDKITGKGLSTEDYTTAEKTKLDGLENVSIAAGTGISVTGAYPNQTIASSHTLYLGQEYLNGIIFYLYIGSDGAQHGLVVSKTESSRSWGGDTQVGANRIEDGQYNTSRMPAGSAARTWVTGLGAGWYLPSPDELILLWQNRFHVDKTARSIGSAILTTGDYWSSYEGNATLAFLLNFANGGIGVNPKTSSERVRAVRAF